MPWHVSRSDECPASKPWAVIKDTDDTVEGCHETEDAAKAQMRALYASEKATEPRHKFCPILDAKALADGEVTAMFSVFGNVDLVGDRIKSGAFTKTLKRWQDSKDPIPVIVSHQWDDVWAHIGYAEPGDVKQMPRGVVAKAKLDVDDNPLAAQAHKLMKRGTFKGWSFGYTVPEGGEKLVEEKSGMVNEITELDLIEIGPTLKGANPEAQLQAAKAWLTREEQAGELGTGKFSMHLAHSLKAWDGSASNYTDEQYAAACVLDRADCSDEWRSKPAKQRYSLPIKAPGASKPDKEGVAAAASRIGSVNACAEAISKAKGRLARAYQQLSMEVPDSLKSFDPPTAEEDVPAQEPREATAQAPDPLYKESMAFVRDDRTEGAMRHQPREEPKPEPPTAKELRRGHRDLMLELLR
jgi:HK97 family phage prohead protease